MSVLVPAGLEVEEDGGGLRDNRLPGLKPWEALRTSFEPLFVGALFHKPNSAQHVMEFASHLRCYTQLSLYRWHVHKHPILLQSETFGLTRNHEHVGEPGARCLKWVGGSLAPDRRSVGGP